MTIDTKDMLNSILQSISRIDYVKPEEIPNIELYMDQVTTFMENQLGSTRRYKEDKILTKTMINNYAKNNLLPPPVKKKYSKEHVLVMIFIYYFKNILSIKDIESLLKPLTDKYFGKNDGFNITSIYEEVCSLENPGLILLQRISQSSIAPPRKLFRTLLRKTERRCSFSLLSAVWPLMCM